MKNSKEYLDKVLNILKPPYFYELENYGIYENEVLEIMKTIFGDDIIIIGGDIYTKSHRIYYELSDGYWCKREFNSYNKCISYEDSNKYWVKYDYDENGNLIYCETSDGNKKNYI
jgi:hypothetical protein